MKVSSTRGNFTDFLGLFLLHCALTTALVIRVNRTTPERHATAGASARLRDAPFLRI